MDFKAQLASDMKVFHNCGEMRTNDFALSKPEEEQ